MHKVIGLILLATIFLFPPLASAQTPHLPQQTYHKAKVIEIKQDGTRDVGGKKNPYQSVVIRFIDGKEKDKELTLDHGGQIIISEAQKVTAGDTVIVTSITQNNRTIYSIIDRYRLPSLGFLSLIFISIVLLMTGKKGLGSLAGLVFSLLIIVLYIVPQIMNGSDPLVTSILGSLAIMLVTLYLAHGFNQRTTIALVSTFLSLILTGIVAIIAVHMAKLSGLGSEDAYNLLLGAPTTINLQGLLLGGIIIGALGVLDDTTTTQSTAIAELAEANPTYSTRHLFQRGMVIGKEHITSLVNTLVLAYAGASIGIFIFITLSLQSHTQPWWVIFNSEIIAEEVIRTLAGSLGLVLAVPITTLLAAFFAKHELKIS